MAAEARLWVKICGVRDEGAALAAAAAGADAIGLVFAPGPRQVDEDTARRIAAAVPGLARVGVFVDPDPERVLGCAERVGLTHVQLHGRVPPELPDLARRAGLVPVRVWRVPPRGAAAPAGEAPPEAGDAAGLEDGDPVLVDTYDPARHGGTGRVGDWDLAARLARRCRLILAGGLTPENVGLAVRAVRPWGVDVSSGVERRPGEKDPERVARFVAAAREAWAALAAPGDGREEGETACSR